MATAILDRLSHHSEVITVRIALREKRRSGLIKTVVDTSAKLGACPWARRRRDPRDRKTPIIAAELLNDRVVPFYEEHGIRLFRNAARSLDNSRQLHWLKPPTPCVRSSLN